MSSKPQNKSDRIPQNVLLVDADALIQTMVKSYLGGVGCNKLTTFTKGADALKSMETENYDLIILDWKLKDPPGPELFRSMREKPESVAIPVILISGMITRQDVEIIKTNPNTNFLIKPFTEEVMLGVVAKSHPGANPKKKKKKSNNVMTSSSASSLGEKSDMFHIKGNGQPPPAESEVHKNNRIAGGGSEVDQGLVQHGSMFIDKKDPTNLGNGSFVDKQPSSGQGNDPQIFAKNNKFGGDPQIFEADGKGGAFDATPEKFKSNWNPASGPEADASGAGFAETQQGNQGSDLSGRFHDPARDLSIHAKQNQGMGSDLSGKFAREESAAGNAFDGVQTRAGTPGAPTGTPGSAPTSANSGDILDAPKTPSILAGFGSNGAPSSKDAKDVDPDEALLDFNEGTPQGEIQKLQSRALNLKSVLIVDKDASMQALLRKYLGDIGVRDVTMIDHGGQAWDQLAKRRFDLVIMDWKIPGLSGLALYNRIRKSKEFGTIPVIIACGFAAKQDFRIIEEHPATTLIEKPFQITSFDKAMAALFERVRGQDQIMRTVVEFVNKGLQQRKTVIDILEAMLQTLTVPLPAVIAAGKYLFNQKLFEDAEKAFRIAFKLNHKNVEVLSWLGKVYHRLNRCEEALKLLSRAEGLSPDNLERLCLLGEVGLTLQQPDKARGYFKNALVIDKEDPTAAAGLVLSDNLSEFILSSTNKAEPMERKFASMLNIVGITFVRNKHYDKGVSQYKAALCFIDDPHTQAKLQFNLALAYLRARDYERSKEWLEKSSANADLAFTKAREFLARLDSYSGGTTQGSNLINEGKPFDFVEVDETDFPEMPQKKRSTG